jgi:nitrate/TMAO reductase-like tetraheme cytochrome c subunit
MKLHSLIQWVWAHRVLSISIAAVLAIVCSGGGVAVGLTLEENNDFCASCHTQPEMAYVARTRAAYKSEHDISDLATFHIAPTPENKQPQRAPLKCISCHGGATTSDRFETLLTLGVGDGLRFITGQYHHPARTTRPLPDSYCAQCHQNDIEPRTFANHFHYELKAREAPPLACVSCHPSHREADALNRYILKEAAYPQCNACHKIMGGPINLR